MMTLIIGGSGSGKSAYAEDYITSLSGEKKKYYIAAMQVCDAESEKKVERHKSLRNGRGFSVIEQPSDIEKAAGKMEAGERTALLECITNLTANEMFAGEVPDTEEAVVERIVGGVEALRREVAHLAVVSDNVFEDGKVYDKTTMAYIRTMGRINEKMAEMADEVVEVVVGIPLAVKSGMPGGGRKEGKSGCIF